MQCTSVSVIEFVGFEPFPQAIWYVSVYMFQAMKSLETLAGVAGKTVAAIMEPHKEVLQDMIPPKKHLLRHQPANAQIGLMVYYICHDIWTIFHIDVC